MCACNIHYLIYFCHNGFDLKIKKNLTQALIKEKEKKNEKVVDVSLHIYNVYIYKLPFLIFVISIDCDWCATTMRAAFLSFEYSENFLREVTMFLAPSLSLSIFIEFLRCNSQF